MARLFGEDFASSFPLELMSKRLTVFYSWQSDTPSSLNRSFIERALEEALKRLKSDAALEPALRDKSVELDKDTSGVAGSPPIAETILNKIEECTAFVADLTFVGGSLDELVDAGEKPRLMPNPNVLIEYGYALRCHSHSALVSVINNAYGSGDPQSLPFDLRHLRWPIRYTLTKASSAAEKAAQFEKLSSAFVEALRLILTQRASLSRETTTFVPQPSTQDASVFFNDPNELIPDMGWSWKPGTLVVPNEGRVFLRLYPTQYVTPFETELDCENAARRGNLTPMGRIQSWGPTRNVYGAIVYDSPGDGTLNHFVQLFLSREIWAVDALCVNATKCRRHHEEWNQPLSRVYIASGYLTEVFLGALHNYIAVAKNTLQLPLPVKVKAGLVGVKDYQIALGNNSIRGQVLQNSIEWEGEISSYDTLAHEVATPFLAKVWKVAGIEWTASDTQALAQYAKQRGFVAEPAR